MFDIPQFLTRPSDFVVVAPAPLLTAQGDAAFGRLLWLERVGRTCRRRAFEGARRLNSPHAGSHKFQVEP
jgi:hypothetical protein